MAETGKVELAKKIACTIERSFLAGYMAGTFPPEMSASEGQRSQRVLEK
jgi:hypothetical protein